MMKKFGDKKYYLSAAFLIAFGIVFLLENLFGFNSQIAFLFLFKFWPLALIISGVMILINSWEKQNNSGEGTKGHIESDKETC